MTILALMCHEAQTNTNTKVVLNDYGIYILNLISLLKVLSVKVPGMDFMQQIANNLQRIQAMNNAMMRDGMRRANAARRYGPGATRFRTADGGVGYVYK